jgi:molecular chaperone GrpE
MTEDKKDNYQIKIADDILSDAVASIDKVTEEGRRFRAADNQDEEFGELEIEIVQDEDESDSSDSEQALAEKAQESQENYDRFLRVSAEFDNFRKRIQREKADAHNFGNEKLLREIIPVLDNIERGVESALQSQDFDALLKGLELTGSLFRGVLRRFNVTEVEAKDLKFDPNLHEAMMRDEESDLPPDTVVDVHQKGYMLLDRLLRPAMVTVSAKISEPPPPENQDDGGASVSPITDDSQED